MKPRLHMLAAAAGLVFSIVTPLAGARADDTGLAQSLHDVRREGFKLCQVDHFHNGTSAGAASKRGAMAQAIDSWQNFTALEYGTDWAQFRNAGSKTANCKAGSSGWSCEVEARPCKALGRPMGRRRR